MTASWRKLLVVTASLAVLLITPLVSAASTTTTAVTQSYGTDAVLQRGMLVRFAEGSSDKVMAVAARDAAQVSGVVVAANDASVTLSNPSETSRQVFVAPAGRYAVLVSNQDGSIAVGDYLAVSALDGIAKKASGTDKTAIGRAVSVFDGKSTVSGETSLKTDKGSKKVAIGLITADINLGRNPLQTAPSNSMPGIGYLQTAATAVSGKAVSPARIYISLFVLLAVAVIVSTILYSGVRSGITSIGRNPLARGQLKRGLWQVGLLALSIFIIGLVAVYLIVKL